VSHALHKVAIKMRRLCGNDRRSTQNPKKKLLLAKSAVIRAAEKND
jgi:hypothetical protein